MVFNSQSWEMTAKILLLMVVSTKEKKVDCNIKKKKEEEAEKQRDWKIKKEGGSHSVLLPESF